jgi:AcrR family transcriptional regulator
VPELETKERLLRVAIDLFAARGFAGTSIRDIAKAMGMSISNIYHYYGSKEGILLAILDRASWPLLAGLEQAAALDGAPLERFAHLVDVHVGLSHRINSESRIYTIDLRQLPSEAREAARAIQRRILDLYVGQLQLLADAGLVRSGDVTATAFNVMAVINWSLRWYQPEGTLSLAQLTDEVRAFVLGGALVPAAAEQLALGVLTTPKPAVSVGIGEPGDGFVRPAAGPAMGSKSAS